MFEEDECGQRVNQKTHKAKMALHYCYLLCIFNMFQISGSSTLHPVLNSYQQ